MQKPNSNLILRMETQIDAKPETVYRFLTEPDLLKQWLGDHIETNPKPGGVFRVGKGEQDLEVSGKYLELIPNEKVVFTWGWESVRFGIPPGSTTVEFRLQPQGTGTRLVLEHWKLEGKAREEHARGWERAFLRLTAAVKNPKSG